MDGKGWSIIIVEGCQEDGGVVVVERDEVVIIIGGVDAVIVAVDKIAELNAVFDGLNPRLPGESRAEVESVHHLPLTAQGALHVVFGKVDDQGHSVEGVLAREAGGRVLWVGRERHDVWVYGDAKQTVRGIGQGFQRDAAGFIVVLGGLEQVELLLACLPRAIDKKIDCAHMASSSVVGGVCWHGFK